MRRILGIISAGIMIFSASGISAFASTSSAEVYVSVSKSGISEAAYEKVSVSDFDSDGILSVSDALFAIHEQSYEGGGESGYSAYESEYGLSLSMLWGDDSGTFGYYRNNTSCLSLADEISDGDHIYAYVFEDVESYSDMYTFFDSNTLNADEGEEITLTLSGAGYDENWNPVTLPIKDAVITVNGEATEFVTDENGVVTFEFDSAGTFTVSAQSESQVIVPPVCIAEISQVQEEISTTESESDAESEANETTESENTPAPDTNANFESFYVYLTLAISLAVITIGIVCAKRRYEE